LPRMLLLPMVLLACALAACGQNYSDKPVEAALAEKNLTPVAAASPALQAATANVPAYGETSAAEDEQEWEHVKTTVPAPAACASPSIPYLLRMAVRARALPCSPGTWAASTTT